MRGHRQAILGLNMRETICYCCSFPSLSEDERSAWGHVVKEHPSHLWLNHFTRAPPSGKCDSHLISEETLISFFLAKYIVYLSLSCSGPLKSLISDVPLNVFFFVSLGIKESIWKTSMHSLWRVSYPQWNRHSCAGPHGWRWDSLVSSMNWLLASLCQLASVAYFICTSSNKKIYLWIIIGVWGKQVCCPHNRWKRSKQKCLCQLWGM